MLKFLPRKCSRSLKCRDHWNDRDTEQIADRSSKPWFAGHESQQDHRSSRRVDKTSSFAKTFLCGGTLLRESRNWDGLASCFAGHDVRRKTYKGRTWAPTFGCAKRGGHDFCCSRRRINLCRILSDWPA